MVGVVSGKPFFTPVWTYLRVRFLNQFPGGVASTDAQGSPDFREGDVMSQQMGGTSYPPDIHRVSLAAPVTLDHLWVGRGAGTGGKTSSTCRDHVPCGVGVGFLSHRFCPPGAQAPDPSRAHVLKAKGKAAMSCDSSSPRRSLGLPPFLFCATIPRPRREAAEPRDEGNEGETSVLPKTLDIQTPGSTQKSHSGQ